MLKTLRAIIQLMRPAQWVKNVFVFGALVFGAKREDPDAIFFALVAFGIFCLLSASVYAFNDLLDYQEDAKHPSKKNRPVASGAISSRLAGAIALLLAGVGIVASLRLPQGFALTAGCYLALNLVYSLWGKRQALLDVILIAIGFVLRALGGAQAIDVPVSAWLVVCTFTLCLFLGFGKRRCELAVLQTSEKAASHRATLSEYSLELLTQLLAVTGAMAVITFLLYTLDPYTPTPHLLVFTTPLVFYAIFRYAMIISRGERTGPTDVLIHDRPFLITAILWTLLTMTLIYFQDQGIENYLPNLRYPGTPPISAPTSP
ncbi:MAG: decaprenyl-phosphate phosphoribosyltransferase [Phycisphaerales bacterium]|nr:decaprenyl-phosphate phosphoribosyltransferase [Phycisphaerales bacterium]